MPDTHHHQRYIRAVSKVRGEPELVSLSNGDQLRRVTTDDTELSAPKGPPYAIRS